SILPLRKRTEPSRENASDSDSLCGAGSAAATRGPAGPLPPEAVAFCCGAGGGCTGDGSGWGVGALSATTLAGGLFVVSTATGKSVGNVVGGRGRSVSVGFFGS